MAKYWVFQNNQVNGPHDPDDLAELPGFCGETLVCSEGRKGTSMGDWQRASMLPELSVALLKASQLVGSMKGAATGSIYGSLPPEPTLKDLAALGSLQEKVSLLDNVVGQLQESLRLKETELLSLHRELEDKNKQAGELANKLGGLEERLSSVNELREGLDKAVAAENEVAQTVEKQTQTIEELTKQLESERSEVDRLRGQLEELKSRPAAPPPPAPAPFPAPRPLGLPSERPAPADAPAAPLSASPLSPALPESPSASPAPFASAPVSPALDAPGFGAPPASAPGFPSGPAPLSAEPAPGFTGVPDLSSPPAPSFGLPAAGEPGFTSPIGTAPIFPTAGLEAPPAAAPAFSAAAAAPIAPPPVGDLAAAPPKKKPPVALLALAVLALGAGAAFKLGLIPGLSPKPRAFQPESKPLPPPPPPVPKGPTPEELAEQAKQNAIALVRGWACRGKTVGDILETPSVSAGGLTPWMAEPINNELFQVNFYSPKSSGGSGQTYEFEADLTARTVAPHNAAAKHLLAPPKRPKARKPKIRIKPKKAPAAEDAPLLNDLLGDDATSDEPAKDENGGARAAKKQAGAGDTLVTGEDQAPAKRGRAAKAKTRQPSLDDLLKGGHEPAKRKAAQDESLDQILLPGIPRQKPQLGEPQAKPKLGADDAAGDEGSPISGDDSARGARSKSSKKKKAQDAQLLDDLLKP